MARLTVEDCIDRVPNRFELVMLSAQRVRDLAMGASQTVDVDNDKPAVIALREIAEDTIDLDETRHHLIYGADIGDEDSLNVDRLGLAHDPMEELRNRVLASEAEQNENASVDPETGLLG